MLAERDNIKKKRVSIETITIEQEKREERNEAWFFSSSFHSERMVDVIKRVRKGTEFENDWSRIPLSNHRISIVQSVHQSRDTRSIETQFVIRSEDDPFIRPWRSG